PIIPLCGSGSCSCPVRVHEAIAAKDLPTPMWLQFKRRNSKDGHVVPFYATYADPCDYDQPLPAELTLQVDTPFEGGINNARARLNRPMRLIHARDAEFAHCWFSQAIDLGDKSGNPAFWMLEKTEVDTWLLYLRRVS